MALNFKKIWNGLKLVVKASSTSDSTGDMEVLSSNANKLHYHNGTSNSAIVTEAHSATLTNKTFDANGTGNSLSNVETADLAPSALVKSVAGGGTGITPSSTDAQLPSALAVKSYVDAAIGSVNEASEITVSPAVAGATNVQSALSNINTAIVDHIADTSAAHNASAIAITPAITNLTATDVQAAFQEIQGDIDSLTSNKVTGPASATDEAIARYDLTTGKLLQNSLVKIDDAGQITGATKLTVDSIVLDAAKVVSSSNAASYVEVTGAINITTSALSINSKLNFANAEVEISGANATLPVGNGSYFTLINAGLLSIEMISGVTAISTIIMIANRTGHSIDLLNETGATATQQIYTGTGGNFTLLDKQTILLSYSDVSGGKWVIVGGNSPDIEYSATILNNQSVATDITGMILNDTLYRGFTIDYLVWRANATESKIQYGQLRAVYNANTSTWYLSDNFSGQDAGVEFSVNINQVQYTSSNMDPTDYGGYIKFIYARQITG